jgi:hypothetical protein
VEHTLVAAGNEEFWFAAGSPMRISWMVSSTDNNFSPMYIGYKPRVIIGTLGTLASIYDTKNRNCRAFNLLHI